MRCLKPVSVLLLSYLTQPIMNSCRPSIQSVMVRVDRAYVNTLSVFKNLCLFCSLFYLNSLPSIKYSLADDLREKLTKALTSLRI